MYKRIRSFKGNVLPVGQVAVSLSTLSAEVGQVTGEEEIVRRGDSESIAHENSSVDGQSSGHRAGDTARSRISNVDLCSSQLVLQWREQFHVCVQLTSQGPSGCPSQPQWGYRSWRQGPRSLHNCQQSGLQAIQAQVQGEKITLS